MIDILPYFAGFITVLFGAAFALGILREDDEDYDSKSNYK